MTPERFRKILTYEERGVSAFLWRRILSVIRLFYAAGVWYRNRQFDRNPNRIFRASVPVLSIGNLTLGGTGKSPAVIRIALELEKMGLKPAVLSRGYRAKEQNHSQEDGLNDEGREMAARLPNAVFLQNPNRCESARRAVEEFGADVILLDDGFQHRKLFRDADLVLIDAEEPFGINGKLFPCGTLREPMKGLERADAIFLTHSERMNLRERHSLQEELSTRFPMKKGRLWIETVHRPTAILAPNGKALSIPEFCEELTNSSGMPLRLGAFCGIGKPSGFFQTLSQIGIIPADQKIYPDHHPFCEKELEELHEWMKEKSLDALLCTEKDRVKFPRNLPEDFPLFTLRIELEFLSGEKEFLEWLSDRISSVQTETPPEK